MTKSLFTGNERARVVDRAIDNSFQNTVLILATLVAILSVGGILWADQVNPF